MALTTVRNPPLTITYNTVTNTITTYNNVTQGWQSKLNATDGAYGFFMAVVIVACIVFGALFCLTMKRINATRAKNAQMKKELQATEQKIKEAQVLLKNHEYMAQREMEEARRQQ